MRSVLIVLGIAIVAIGISIALQRPKDLTPDPQTREEARKAAAEKDVAQRNGVIPPGQDEPFNPPRQGLITTVLTVKGKGDITIELYPKAAPKTVAQVSKLIKDGFYNGILFHRVVPQFVVQAGDPESKKYKPSDLAGKSETQITGMGLGAHGSGNPIAFEANDLKHVTGTLAMALSSRRSDTGDSQFFINLKPNHPLDGDYCVFGKVVKGMEAVNRIEAGDAIERWAVQ